MHYSLISKVIHSVSWVYHLFYKSERIKVPRPSSTSAWREMSRRPNPWEKFTQRDERKHVAEDVSRLCRPASTTSDVIKHFLTHGFVSLHESVPRQRQLLKDFLNVVVSSASSPSITYLDDIQMHSTVADIALLDDRNKHIGCLRTIGQPCVDCYIFSRKLTIPELCTRLRDRPRTKMVNKKIDKRIIYIPNITSAGAVVLAATCASRSTIPVRDFLHRYLEREHIFSASTSWGFFLEFHIPYHAMHHGPIKDLRTVSGKQLRKSEPLPLRSESKDQEDLFYHEAQTSSLSWGPDESFWTELFLVDTYFGSEKNHQTYLTPSSNCEPGDGFDPALGGQGSMRRPLSDPREYFLLKVDRRIDQVATEYSALVETFNKRMDEYLRKTRNIIQDDSQMTNTRTLSNVIETIHVFVDCMGGTIDAWNAFSSTDLILFTKYAPDKLAWPAIIIRISRNISSLDRLRRLLITKRERLNFKLKSLHTVSNLSQSGTANDQAKIANIQAQIAVSQGEDLKRLTQMTVYVAFPLLFTTAFFSMDFVDPPHPWAVFFGVLPVVSVVNYMVASHSGPSKVWKDVKGLF